MRNLLHIVPLVCGALLTTTGWVRAVDPEAVDRAIKKGVEYLKAQQLGNGTWDHPQIGATALAGLALMHSGVPANDPAIRRAAAAVRAEGINLTYNYSLSLSILFLDMVGEESDIPLIQAMGIRLLAGQTPLGGWNYSCLDPGPKERKQLADLLQQHRPPSPPPPPPMMPWVPPLAHPMNRQRAQLDSAEPGSSVSGTTGADQGGSDAIQGGSNAVFLQSRG